MPISTRYTTLRLIALTEFPSAVVSANIIALSTGDPLKLRLDIGDGSLIDIFYLSTDVIPITGNGA